jgi:hypothetical protein
LAGQYDFCLVLEVVIYSSKHHHHYQVTALLNHHLFEINDIEDSLPVNPIACGLFQIEVCMYIFKNGLRRITVKNKFPS